MGLRKTGRAISVFVLFVALLMLALASFFIAIGQSEKGIILISVYLLLVLFLERTVILLAGRVVEITLRGSEEGVKFGVIAADDEQSGGLNVITALFFDDPFCLPRAINLCFGSMKILKRNIKVM